MGHNALGATTRFKLPVPVGWPADLVRIRETAFLQTDSQEHDASLGAVHPVRQ